MLRMVLRSFFFICPLCSEPSKCFRLVKYWLYLFTNLAVSRCEAPIVPFSFKASKLMAVACCSYLINHVNGVIFAMSQLQLHMNMFLKWEWQRHTEKTKQMMSALIFPLSTMECRIISTVLGIARLFIFSVCVEQELLTSSFVASAVTKLLPIILSLWNVLFPAPPKGLWMIDWWSERNWCSWENDQVNLESPDYPYALKSIASDLEFVFPSWREDDEHKR